MAKKILIHSLIFSPDGVSTAYLYNDIALRFKESGYEVVVLTTTPHYNPIESQLTQQPLKWKIWGICKESTFKGIQVIHVPQKKFKNTLFRLLGFIYWHLISFLLGLCIGRVDVILSPSPPLTIGYLNLLLGKLKKCKVVYNVQEIYPDILGKSEGLIFNILRRMEYKVYNGSDAVTTIDKIFYNTIVGRFKDRGKLHIIPNFVDTQLYRPGVLTKSLDKTLFPETENIKLLYAGNIGFAQDWEPLIRLAEKTRDLKVEYFVIGEGVMKPYITKKQKELKLEKLHILPYQLRSQMPAILSYSDVQFIFMDPKMEQCGFPSKVYTIMACDRPLLVCSGSNTPIVDFLQPIGCAKLLTEHDLEKKTDIITQWLTEIDREKLYQMGKCGGQEIQKKYTKEIVTKQYVELVDSLFK